MFCQVYADCLAQALFAAFWEAFPESERYFHDTFKQFLCNITAEWVSGGILLFIMLYSCRKALTISLQYQLCKGIHQHTFTEPSPVKKHFFLSFLALITEALH